MATKSRKSVKPVKAVKAVPKLTMLVLKYYERGVLSYSYFTTGEQELAVGIAASYDSKGYSPRLYYSPYDGEGFRTLYDWKSRARRAAKEAA